MNWKKRMLSCIILLALLAAVCMIGCRERGGFPVFGKTLEEAGEKKIALTFDDDVIIGLSQEISCKEAVSMI